MLAAAPAGRGRVRSVRGVERARDVRAPAVRDRPLARPGAVTLLRGAHLDSQKKPSTINIKSVPVGVGFPVKVNCKSVKLKKAAGVKKKKRCRKCVLDSKNKPFSAYAWPPPH